MDTRVPRVPGVLPIALIGAWSVDHDDEVEVDETTTAHDGPLGARPPDRA
jgi:hypothetical protein